MRCWASRVQGGLRPAQEPLARRTFLHMGDSVECTDSAGVGDTENSAGGTRQCRPLENVEKREKKTGSVRAPPKEKTASPPQSLERGIARARPSKVRGACKCCMIYCICADLAQHTSTCRTKGRLTLLLLELQARFGDKPVKFQVMCPPNGAAVLKRLRS